MPIDQARSLPLGSVVTVNGAVTTPSGAFESSFLTKALACKIKQQAFILVRKAI